MDISMCLVEIYKFGANYGQYGNQYNERCLFIVTECYSGILSTGKGGADWCTGIV